MKISETTLRQLIPDLDTIDVQDCYQVYCAFYLNFCECIECHKKIDLVDLAEVGGTPSWTKIAAQYVRSLGWFVPPSDEFHYLIAFCPDCLPETSRGGHVLNIDKHPDQPAPKKGSGLVV